MDHEASPYCPNLNFNLFDQVVLVRWRTGPSTRYRAFGPMRNAVFDDEGLLDSAARQAQPASAATMYRLRYEEGSYPVTR
jgi:hypothetical protein